MKKTQRESKPAVKKATEARKVGRPVRTTPGSEVEDLKVKILEAYFEICRFEGIEHVTLQKVADRSGVALTTVRYHFQMKGLSLSQVAQDYVSDKTYEFLDLGLLNARSQPNYNPVLAYIHVTFDWLEQQPVQASFLIYFYYLCTTQVPISIGNKELVEIAQRRVLSFVYEGVGMGLYKLKDDPVQVSNKVHMLIMGASMIAITSRSTEFARTQRDTCIQWASQMLGM